jgi:hypothetical protein
VNGTSVIKTGHFYAGMTIKITATGSHLCRLSNYQFLICLGLQNKNSNRDCTPSKAILDKLKKEMLNLRNDTSAFLSDYTTRNYPESRGFCILLDNIRFRIANADPDPEEGNPVEMRTGLSYCI